jgi:uncharacterized membrane protein YebE (DUF533 family)
MLVGDRVLDNGLSVLDTESTHMYLCSSEPATFTQATSTYALGNNNFGVGAVFGAPAAGSPNGRKVSSAAVSGGSITASGTAAYWAATDNTNSRLSVEGPLSATQVVTSGNTWGMASLDVRLPNQ